MLSNVWSTSVMASGRDAAAPASGAIGNSASSSDVCVSGAGIAATPARSKALAIVA